MRPRLRWSQGLTDALEMGQNCARQQKNKTISTSSTSQPAQLTDSLSISLCMFATLPPPSFSLPHPLFPILPWCLASRVPQNMPPSPQPQRSYLVQGAPSPHALLVFQWGRIWARSPPACFSLALFGSDATINHTAGTDKVNRQRERGGRDKKMEKEKGGGGTQNAQKSNTQRFLQHVSVGLCSRLTALVPSFSPAAQWCCYWVCVCVCVSVRPCGAGYGIREAAAVFCIHFLSPYILPSFLLSLLPPLPHPIISPPHPFFHPHPSYDWMMGDDVSSSAALPQCCHQPWRRVLQK